MESLKEDVGLTHLRLGKDVSAAVAKRAPDRREVPAAITQRDQETRDDFGLQ